MDTNTRQDAANTAKDMLGDAKTIFSDGLNAAKDKFDRIRQDAKTPEGREAMKEKAGDFFDTVKDKTADVLRAGASGARKLADKLDR